MEDLRVDDAPPADAFDDDPILIFAWRGRGREKQLAELRARRGGGGAAPPADEAERAPRLGR